MQTNTLPDGGPMHAASPTLSNQWGAQILSNLRTHLAFLLILAVYVGLASTYSIVNPLFESPDEIWHYEYVRWLVEGHGLPQPDDVGHAPWHQEGSQPPLYYLTAAALTAWIPTDNADAVIRYNPHAAIGQPDAPGNKNMMAHGPPDAWPWQGVALAAHMARFFSIILGGVTVVCTYAAARVVFPKRRAVALAAAALVAFNPQFLFLSGAINNDNLVTACSAMGIWFALYLLARRETAPGDNPQPAAPTALQLVLFGGLAGMGALSKLSGLLLCVLVALTLSMIAWRRRRGLGDFALTVLRWGLISGGAALLVAGWWYLRNWLLFGDPLALQAMFAILPRRPAPPTVAELLARAPGVWHSVWAVFGWFNVVVDEWLYAVYTTISLVGLLGFLLVGPMRLRLQRTANSQESIDNQTQRWQIALLLIWLALIVLSLLRWAQMRYPQGRLLYPALSTLAVVVGCGLLNWFPRRWQRGVATLLTVGLLTLAALAPWRWIAPTYAAPALLPLDTPVENPVDVRIGDAIQLRGYSISAEEVHPGDRLIIELFWEATEPVPEDYSVFIHLTDNYEILQAQRDSYPAAGALATSDWPTGALIPDRHVVEIPETVPAPARMRVDVGLYAYGTDTRLPVDESVEEGQDFLTLGYITLLPPEGDGDLPHSIFVNFDDQIALVGFEFDRRVMQPGETLGLTLWWEALDTPRGDYKVFTHLILPPDATWAQMDSRPQRGGARTDTWEPGQRIEDHYELTLPESAPPGVYFVEIGIYDPDTNDRLMVNFSDKGVVLGQVRVE